MARFCTMNGPIGVTNRIHARSVRAIVISGERSGRNAATFMMSIGVNSITQVTTPAASCSRLRTGRRRPVGGG
jgi:hypothetical protein